MLKNTDLYIDRSKINGRGLFTKIDIKQGEVILEVADLVRMMAGLEWITNAGKMINHQTNCNTFMKERSNKFVLVSSRDILRGEELTTDYKLLPPDVFKTKTDNYTEV